MAHFLVFLPNVSGQSPALLDAVGLGDFAPGAEFMEIGSGPDGARGVLIGWRRPGGDQRLNFVVEKQNWTPAVRLAELPAARYWVGWWKDMPPRSIDLVRKQTHQGHAIELGNGEAWRFPSAALLSRDIIVTDAGDVELVLQERFRPFCEEVAGWITRLRGSVAADDSAPYRVAYGEVFDFLVRALRMNYRLTAEIAAELRLFNTENMSDPLISVLGVRDEQPTVACDLA